VISPNKSKENLATTQDRMRSANKSCHPAWRALIKYCAELEHGEIEVLKIQDGLPVLAEVTRKKVKFGG
jgi:hypothetical protein